MIVKEGKNLLQMIVINLTKQPKWKTPMGVGALLRYTDQEGLQVGLPTPTPVMVRTADGYSLGAGFSLLTGRF